MIRKTNFTLGLFFSPWSIYESCQVVCYIDDSNKISQMYSRCALHEAMVYHLLLNFKPEGNISFLAQIRLLPGNSNKMGVGGAVASWLVSLTLDQAAWVGALAGDIVLCS